MPGQPDVILPVSLLEGDFTVWVQACTSTVCACILIYHMGNTERAQIFITIQNYRLHHLVHILKLESNMAESFYNPVSAFNTTLHVSSVQSLMLLRAVLLIVCCPLVIKQQNVTAFW